MSESDIEGKICAYAERRGWMGMKFISPQLDSVPDRLFLRRKNNISRTVFIEVKDIGKQPSAKQMKRARELSEHGAEVYWVDNVDDAMEILK